VDRAGANPKKVQRWAGNASIQFTMDVFGHLRDDSEADAKIAEGAIESISEGRMG
jgi:hypothetical protein